jgi:uncharacterized protein with HEPN domain
MKDDKLYLIHIRECIERVEKYTAEGGKGAFLVSTLIQDAVMRNLQTMAESTQRLSNATKEAHPGVDWYRISGFRNVLVHGYLGVDLDRLWIIVERDLPGLRRAITSMLKEQQ